MNFLGLIGRRALAAACALSTAGCASLVPGDPSREAMLRANALSPDDPYAEQNRSVLRFNKVVNDAAISPAAKVYRGFLPTVVRDRIANGISNLEEPRVFANNMLQARFGAATKTAGRFLINSTLGLGGTFDIADAGGLRRQTGDFGQTLYVWGVPSGPFLIAPIAGPTTLRDGFGKLVDTVADPSSYVLERYFGPFPVIGIGFVAALERVDLLDDVEAGSVDFYGRLRSTYLQKRASELGEAVGITLTPGGEPPPPAAPPAPKPKAVRRR